MNSNMMIEWWDFGLLEYRLHEEYGYLFVALSLTDFTGCIVATK